jgi:ankyrin repeat protein
VVVVQATGARIGLPAALDGAEETPLGIESYLAAKRHAVATTGLTEQEAEAGLAGFYRPNATTALFLAAAGDLAPQIKAVLESNLVNAAVSDRNGCTPLHAAAKAGAGRATAALLAGGGAAGVNVRAFGEHGTTALHHASTNGSPVVVQALVQASADPDILTMDSGDGEFGALHYACLKGHWEAAEILVRQGYADVNLANSDGVTPLHATSLHGSVGVARSVGV